MYKEGQNVVQRSVYKWKSLKLTLQILRKFGNAKATRFIK